MKNDIEATNPSGVGQSDNRLHNNRSCGCAGSGHGYLMLIVAALFILYAVATVLF